MERGNQVNFEKPEDLSDGEEESYDSMEGKPEEYVTMVRTARPIFED